MEAPERENNTCVSNTIGDARVAQTECQAGARRFADSSISETSNQKAKTEITCLGGYLCYVKMT